MKRKLLIGGVVLIGIVLLLVVASFLFNANRFRPGIEARLQAALGRRVEIGSLRFSLLAGGISADNIVIADDPVFGRSPFVRARSLDVGVEIWPLITSRALHIESVALREPELVLIQSPRGTWNFASIGRQEHGLPARSEAKTASELSIQKLKVSKGRVVIIRPADTQTYSDVNFEAKDVSYSASFPFTFSATTPGNGKLKSEGKAGPVPSADPSQTPFQAALEIDHLDLGSSGYFGRGSGVGGVLNLKGSARSDGRTVHLETAAKTEKLRLAPGGVPTRQPVAVDLTSDYDLKTQAGRVTRGDVYPRAGGKQGAHLTGTYDTRGSIAVLRMDVKTENLPTTELDNLLPAAGISMPGGASLQGGTVGGELAISGPVDKLVVAGPLHAAEVKLAGFNLGSKLGGIGPLAGINTGPDTLIQRLTCKLREAPEGMRFDDINAQIAGLGTVTGAGAISANHALDFQLATKLAGGGGLLGALVQSTGRGQINTVAFRIGGTTNNPTFTPDVGTMVQKPSGQPTQQQPGNPLEGFMGIFGKKK
jgi:AsmA protein